MPITLQNYLTASGRYPDRAKSSELTPEYLKNADNLLLAVNALLTELSWTKAVNVSSGFRPSVANSAAGGAKKSRHRTCNAIDLVDDSNQTLGKLLLRFPDLLRKHGLFMENLLYTTSKTNWVHLQYSPEMKDRPSRTFIP